MSVMATLKAFDRMPVLDYLAQHGGEASFEELLRTLERLGMSESDGRDALWRLLSQGFVEFTAERRVRIPNRELERAAG